MPPKKVAPAPVPAASAGSDEPSMLSVDGGPADGSGKGKKKQSDMNPGEVQLGIEEYMMPRMMTVRLAKGVLPPQTLIHKDAATAMQFSTSVFLNHIANAANEHTLNAGRKNISPQDILEGIRETEWGFLIPQLEEELAIYVRTVNDKRNEYRRRLKERDSGVGVPNGAAKDGDGAEDQDESMDDPDDGPKFKRARLSEGITLDESQLEEEIPEDAPDDDEGGDDEVEDDEQDDDDDDNEQYGSAAEDLPGDDDIDDRDGTGGSEDESD